MKVSNDESLKVKFAKAWKDCTRWTFQQILTKEKEKIGIFLEWRSVVKAEEPVVNLQPTVLSARREEIIGHKSICGDSTWSLCEEKSVAWLKCNANTGHVRYRTY